MTNPVIDRLLNHRSIRKFKPDPINPDTLELLLRAGTRAASAGNLQRYSLVVVDDAEIKDALLKTQKIFAPAIVIVALVDEYRMKRWLELNNAPFYNDRAANVFIGFWDAVIALQNIVVAAESVGLGTVYIGGALGTDTASILGTPEYVIPAGMVCIGHPDESPELRPRLPLDAVVHRNGYQIPTDDEIREFYREKDKSWDDLPEEQRQDLIERGITNTAQRITVGHYTEQFIANRSKAIFRNLKKAKFRVAEAE